MSETTAQAYISKVHLQGYKSIRDLEIDFKSGLNIIIGQNGSGKTNFLEFIYNLQDSIDYPALNKQEFLGEVYLNNLKHIVLDGKFKIDAKNAFFNIGEKKFSNNHLIRQRLIIHDINKNVTSMDFIEDDIENLSGRYNAEISVSLYNIGFIRFSSKHELDKGLSFVVKKHKYNNFLPINSFSNPYELFTLLYNSIKEIDNSNIDKDSLKSKISINNQTLLKNLQDFTPIKDLSIENDAILIQEENADTLKVTNVHFKFFINNQWLYWSQLSDGTKRLFYIVTKLTSGDDTYYFIEEPELGIHPEQLYKLMAFLKEQAEKMQIIITTHSPDVLNVLGAEGLDRIIVTQYDTVKGTMMRKLKAPQIKKARKYMESAGLFLSDYWVHSNLEAAAYETSEKN